MSNSFRRICSASSIFPNTFMERKLFQFYVGFSHAVAIRFKSAITFATIPKYVISNCRDLMFRGCSISHKAASFGEAFIRHQTQLFENSLNVYGMGLTFSSSCPCRDFATQNLPKPKKKIVVKLEKPIYTLSHEHIYIVDSTLIIGYSSTDDNPPIPGWKTWANQHLSLGKKFFILPQSFQQIQVRSSELPKGFEVLRLQENARINITQDRLSAVYKMAVEKFAIEPKKAEKLKSNIEIIALADYFGRHAVNEQISDEDLSKGQIVFATNNYTLIQRTLLSKEKREIFEKIITESGLGHLISILYISNECFWKNYSSPQKVIPQY